MNVQKQGTTNYKFEKVFTVNKKFYIDYFEKKFIYKYV